MSTFVSSRYNFAIPIDAEFLLYNSSSGSVIGLSGPDCASLISEIANSPKPVSVDAFEPELFKQLIAGSFLVMQGVDEVAAIRERFQSARTHTPAVLTITTTMDCNLGCYYCYEERSGDQLAVSGVPEVVEMARRLLVKGGKDSLHVDWYGGEPLMNLPFLDAASLALQDLCSTLKIAYSASVISNGTKWPKDVRLFVRRHKIRQVQISFDGMRENHDKRRRYHKGYATGGSSSFDKAVELVSVLVTAVRVDLRFNIDRGNRDDVLPFMRFARSKGWFDSNYDAVFQPARLAAYTERSGFMRNTELSLDEYEEIRRMVREESESAIAVAEAEVPDKFPYPRSSVCAALAKSSVVVGADSKLYRCGLQVGERARAVGDVPTFQSGPLQILNNLEMQAGSDLEWWDRFDPTSLSSCSRCSFLPVCWGGCPKKHLEQDTHALLEQGQYWRRNLPRLVAEGVGRTCQPEFSFGESDQFRMTQSGDLLVKAI